MLYFFNLIYTYLVFGLLLKTGIQPLFALNPFFGISSFLLNTSDFLLTLRQTGHDAHPLNMNKLYMVSLTRVNIQ